MICHKHKCILIHIPKTAGVSICNSLGITKGIQRHWNAKTTRRRIGFDKWNSYFTFTFVRNPWDREISSYFYRNEHYTSDDFKLHLIRKDIHFKIPNYFPWFSNVKNQPIVNFIGRFENLQEDFNTVCDKIKIPHQELQHKNKTKHKHYTEYYDDETREIVAEKYAMDIEYFGYEFGE